MPFIVHTVYRRCLSSNLYSERASSLDSSSISLPSATDDDGVGWAALADNDE